MIFGAGILVTLGLAAFFVYLSASATRLDRAGFELPVFLLIFMILAAGLLLYYGDRPEFPAALIVALLVAGSALFGLVFNAAVARETEARQREEKRRDIRRALRAEIDDYVRELEFGAEKRTDGAVDGAFNNDQQFVPFVVVARRDKVFSAVLPQIETLDDEQVETVVRFYALQEKVVELGTQMQAEVYAKLPLERRAAILKSLNSMEETLIEYGRAAMAQLRDHPLAFSTTDQGRSGPEVAE
ncbi:MAG: hypothetical protein QNJ09_16190 [Paracoccaceae bacterium]|nr:hypothetical protein [Paracoccaceae bacterium]